MNTSSFQTLSNIDYLEAQEAFTRLLQQDDLDQYVSAKPQCLEPFEQVLRQALFEAYEDQPSFNRFSIASTD
jgi:hypothetical protein